MKAIADHILVVGGTGMLRSATLHLAKKAKASSVIARNRNNSLRTLVEEGQNINLIINPIEMDYQNTKQLQEKIVQSIKIYGNIDMVIGWFHWVNPKAYAVTIDSIAKMNNEFKYFDIWGLDGGLYCENPDSKREIYLRKIKNLHYRKIILGFVIEKGKSRWLNNEEISSGVIEAVEQDKETHVIGVLEPISARPT